MTIFKSYLIMNEFLENVKFVKTNMDIAVIMQRGNVLSFIR